MQSLTPTPKQVNWYRAGEYRGPLSIGQRVEHGHSCDRGVITAIDGQQRPETVQHYAGFAVCFGGAAMIDVAFETHVARKLPESIVRSWRISDEVLPMIEAGRLLTEALEAERKARDAEARAKDETAQEKAALPARYPWLIPGAKVNVNIRRDLKHHFPGVKFRVHSHHYGRTDIEWTDGPETKAVEAVVTQYEEGYFDGMDDMYHYSEDSAWTDVFGGVRYVFCNRR